MAKKIIVALFLILIIATAVLYAVGIFVGGKSPTEDLSRVLILVLTCILGILRLCIPRRGSHGLTYYEKIYEEHLKGAFADAPSDRKKLLRAVRYFHEDCYDKAVRALTKLQQKCREQADYAAVGLFVALSFTQMGFFEDAVSVYRQLLQMGITSSRIYSNLGYVYIELGKYDEALPQLHLAIQNDDRNEVAYNNLAQLHFHSFRYDLAKQYAKKALELNQKFAAPASLLAIIYAQEDEEEAKRYFQAAVLAGAEPNGLRQAIEHFRFDAARKSDASENEAESE